MNGWPEVDGHLHVYMLSCVGCVCMLCRLCVVWLFRLMLRWLCCCRCCCCRCCCCCCCVLLLLLLLLLSLCFLYEFFLLSGFALSRSTLHMSFAFYRTTKYRKRYIFRYRRLYHFVAIRDCWSTIIVDTLFGGQLIHSYIQDINTSLTYHFWLSGYPASSVFFQSFVERTFNSKEFQCFRCHEVVIMNPLQLMDLRDDVQLKDYGRVTLVDWSTRRPSDLKDLGWGFIQEKLSCKKLFLLQVSPK